jgi:hypothetical protein
MAPTAVVDHRAFSAAVGLEAFIQTPWSSPAFTSGTQPGLMMLFRNTLFWGLVAEYNVGVASDSSQAGFVWFPSDRLSMFGNWGAGTDKSGPSTTFQFGCANTF